MSNTIENTMQSPSVSVKSANESGSTAVEITESTGVKTNLKSIITLCSLLLAGLGGVWGFHSAAIAAIGEKNDQAIQVIELRRTDGLKNYPTWNDIRQLREQDQRYWDDRLERMQKTLIEEIRRTH